MTKAAAVRSMRRWLALEKAAAAPAYLDRGTAANPANTNYLGNASAPPNKPAPAPAQVQPAYPGALKALIDAGKERSRQRKHILAKSATMHV